MIDRNKRKFQNAMTQLILNHPFYACLLLNSEIIYTDAIPTMATDGKRILVNLSFIAPLENMYIQGVLVHEICHMIYLHAQRRGEREPRRFNVAADYAINPIVKESGFTLPGDHLDNPDFHGMTAEAIYNKLPNDLPPPPMEDLHPVNQDEATTNQQQHEMKVTLAKALNIAGSAVPDSLRKMVEEVLEPKIDWKEKLREFVQVSMGNDYTSWSRPNRNHLHEGMYLPSYAGKSVPNIAIMFDTSGSIYCQKSLFEEFTSELNSIIEDLHPESVELYYVDTEIRKHDSYGEYEIPEYELAGGGGTNFISAWPKMEETNPACIIAFTDAWASFPEYSNVPTLWAIYENKDPEVPFGEIISLQ